MLTCACAELVRKGQDGIRELREASSKVQLEDAGKCGAYDSRPDARRSCVLIVLHVHVRVLGAIVLIRIRNFYCADKARRTATELADTKALVLKLQAELAAGELHQLPLYMFGGSLGA